MAATNGAGGIAPIYLAHSLTPARAMKSDRVSFISLAPLPILPRACSRPAPAPRRR